MRRVLLAMAFLAVLAGLALVPTSVAATALPVATYTTPGCDGAPVWRIGYRFYQHSSDGGLMVQEGDGEAGDVYAREELALLVDMIADLGDCGIRWQVDFYDMGSAVYEVRADEFKGYDLPPRDDADFRKAGGYDSTFNAFPEADGAVPRASVARPGVAVFPTATDYFVAPYRTLLLHEWLHLVVMWYGDRVSWPAEDVHGIKTNCYWPSPSGESAYAVNIHYFGDLMTGRVPNLCNSADLRGIHPADWARYGTPRTAPPADNGAAAVEFATGPTLSRRKVHRRRVRSVAIKFSLTRVGQLELTAERYVRHRGWRRVGYRLLPSVQTGSVTLRTLSIARADMRTGRWRVTLSTADTSASLRLRVLR